MRKKIFKSVSIFLSVVFILFIVLGIHIYVVTRHKPVGNMIQLSRIDFQEKIDSSEAGKITGFVGHLYGVQKAYFNIPAGILVYGYTVGKQNSTTVYNDLMTYGHYNAVRVVVDPETIAKGCPIFDKSSFTYRISSFFSKIFN